MDAMDCLRRHRIIAIVRGLSAEHVLPLARALHGGGIRMIEVTFDQSAPESWAATAGAVRAIREAFLDEMAVGAGTVLTDRQLDMALAAGASYMVSPNVDVGIIRQAKAAGMRVFPGALTPTEIITAYNAGADAVKVFPIGSLGAAYIQALRAPLPHIPLLAVGGVNERNCAEYFAAGATGIGAGGNIVNKDFIAAGQWDRIEALAQAYVRAAR